MEQVNNINELKQGVLDGSIPSAVADSGATSSVGTKRDRKKNAFVATGRQSDKAFRMPNGNVEEASGIDELHHDVRHLAKDVHIILGIERNSLLSIPKFADANYVTIFHKDEVKSTMPTQQQSSYPEAQFSEAGNAKIQTYGESPSSNLSSTRTPTQSYAIGARQNFYLTDHRLTSQSSTSTSQKHNPN